VFFDVLKKPEPTAQGEFEDDSVNDQITKLVRASEQTAISDTLRASFRKAGIVPDTSSHRVRLRFDEGRLRENEGFREIWDWDI
jgi:hypothetical protein